MTRWDEIALTGPWGFPIPDLADAHTHPFNMVELVLAAKKLPGGKAPGPDFVLNDVIKIFVKEDPETLLALFNLCWNGSAFPKRWKRVRLVLLYKGGFRPVADPGSIRPISLLDAFAKLFERLMLY